MSKHFGPVRTSLLLAAGLVAFAPAATAGGLDSWHQPISSQNAEAQKHFDRGLLLAYGFNHAGAEAAFREAAKLDPNCAICYWGAALVAGPNINAPMVPEAAGPAWRDLQQGLTLAPRASAKERDYLAALAQRYAENPPEDRAPLDQAYAEAMRGLAAKYPDDPEAQVLLAEALMDLHPWDFWQKDGAAQPWTGEILAVLEKTLARWPDHPGANHYYIHTVEASKEPARAMAAADRLRDLQPAAGHLVHMPAHIYQRIGRYGDSAESNRQAIAADRSAGSPGCHGAMYELAYVPHNFHFLWAALIQEGAEAEAVATAKEMVQKVDAKAMREPGLGALQLYFTIPYFTAVRFGRWEEALAYPEPAPDLVFPRAIRHFARGLAQLRRGDLEAAEMEKGRLAALAADPGLESVTIWEINHADELAKIAVQVLGGEIALARGDGERAIRQLERAVELEDALRYDEPPTWPLSTRHHLGAAWLALKRPASAEQVYTADLERQPENGWALFGLAQSLKAQERPQAAAEIEGRLAKAWTRSAVKLVASTF